MAHDLASPRPVRRVGWGQRISRWDFKLSPYLYISPFFLLFAVFGAFPLVFNVVVALHDWHRRTGMGDFVGLDNFAWVLQQPLFWRSLENTISIFLLGGVPQLFLALLIAAILDQNLRARTFWRMSVLIPFVVMPVATSMIFGQVFGQFGILVPNLQELGLLTDYSSPFFQDRFLSHVAIGSMVVFRWTGYNALILLAAMQAVNRDFYEAATVDGAGPVRQFFSITMPSLKPTLIFVIITSTIGGLQIFDEPRMFDQFGRGGAGQQWLTITLYLYDIGWGQWNFGRAAAMAWILFIIILGIGLINLLITRTMVRDEGLRSELSKRQQKQAVRAAKKQVKEAQR